ncbi:MAG: filamentous hemagglutinin N-terminal domain-containing protein, partial [Mastigocoleus sp. MO_167.B18]|nr:filamentous hemagglutinin N-terminal domain-containing protein [Mastigocoleus sp. MO_167.B18]
MITKTSIHKFWYFSLLGVFITATIEILGLVGNQVFAQSNIVPDRTLGNESSQVLPSSSDDSPVDRITGGAIRGKNLFHSFQEFNIGNESIADFINPSNDIQNILTRVTGNNPSNILGTLRVSNGAGVTSNPNFFLINPNGIIFGEGASLDVPGSFVASTANAIRFREQGFFSTTEPETPQLLTVNPSAFLFHQIANQTINSIESQAFLSVPTNKNLLLVGGNTFPSTASTGKIVLNGGRLRAPGGRIEIGGLGEAGKINLNTIGNNFSLEFPEDIKRVDVSLLNLAEVDVTAGGGGDISIYSQNLDILEGSDICAGIGADLACGGVNQDNGSVNTQAGDITLDATEKITIADPVSEVKNDVNFDAIGNAGDINIKAKQLSISEGAQVSVSTFGEGNAGGVIINVQETVFLDKDENSNTWIRNNVQGSASGNTDGINITTSSLSVNNGAQIQSITRGRGNSGQIRIVARDKVSFDGNNGFPSGAFSIIDPNAQGDSGGLEIIAGSLDVHNGAQLGSWTAGNGNSGNIQINAQEQVSLITSLIISEVSDQGGIGDAGDIKITTVSLLLEDGSSILADTENQGNAGNITIEARNKVVLKGEGPGALNPNQIVPSQISTTVESNAVGEGGNIDIQAGSILFSEGAQLRSETFGKGDSGNIFLQVQDNISLSNSLIISEVSDKGGIGNAGDVKITTGSLLIKDGSSILADTENRGNAGNI